MIVNSVEKVSYADQAGKTDGIYEITADSPCTAAQIFVRIKRYGDMSILLNSKCSICSARPLTENRFAATVINERNEMKAGIYCQPEPRFRRKCLDL
jgi:hypothetical protein